ncbi:MAG: selenide, water dikinase SelD [Burkholderiales bacterium]|nr:selenide, water dikinase SelD [Burkholderiales bacterium]
MNAPHKIRLTEYSHGGGCGCKIAPAVLTEILAATPIRGLPADLLVGTQTADDAAVYRLNDAQAVVATTDFFTPIVDDPYDFGRIAATNALSDVYAMGGRPIFALAVVGMPLDKLPMGVIGRILQGGEAVCTEVGIPVAGGHSIDTLEPIYGLVALGLVHPEHVKRNDTGRDGDVLVLGKPLGVGVLSAALKKGGLAHAGYAAMIETTTKLNTPGEALARLPGVHAMTDVTGFGLAGHLLEMCRGAGLAAQIRLDALPVVPEALEWARQGVKTGASDRNWKSYGAEVELATAAPAATHELARVLLTDPQTSGGLLVACAPQAEAAVLAEFARGGFADARAIGRLAAGAPRVLVR